MYYYSIKHFHILFVVLSMMLLLVRSLGLGRWGQWVEQRWLKLLHYFVNSMMVLLGFTLAAMIGASQPWILMKILGLALYLLTALLAVQPQRSASSRLLALVVTVLVYAYTIGVAINHSPASWFA